MKWTRPEKDITTINTATKAEFRLSKDEVEFPQFESTEEFVQASGGEENAKAWINGHAENDSKTVGRNIGRNAGADSDFAEVVKRAIAAIRSWTPQSDRGPSVKAKVAAFDALVAKRAAGETITLEELEALLAIAK